MASAAEDPILIPSDDEASDCDDVVIIKEEIEVDSDDVIFLSETKPAPVPDSAVRDTENTPTEASARQVGDTSDDQVLNLSSNSKGSLNSVTSQINPSDPNTDLNYNMDISSMCNYYLGPLDLSSKSDSQNQGGSSAKSGNNDIQDLFKSLLFDTDLYNNSHLDSSSCTNNPVDATFKDNQTQGPQNLSNIPCDKVSGSDGDKKNDTGNNGGQSVTQGSDPTKCVSLPDLCSKTFNIDSLLGITSHSTATSVQSDSTVATTSLTNFQGSGTIAKPPDPQTIASNATIVSSSNQVVINCSTNINSSQIFLKSTDPMWSSKDYLVNKIKTSLPCYQMDTASQMPPYSQSGNVPTDNSALINVLLMGSNSAQASSVSQNINLPLQQSGFQSVPQINANLQQTSVSQSGNFSQTGFQTIPQIDAQIQMSTGTQSSNLTGSSLSQGLPGGAQLLTSQSLSLSNQSAFRCLNSSADLQNSGNPQLKRSVSSDQTYMYNPLTLPKSQKESYLRSFSTSSLNSWSSDYYKRKFDSTQSMGAVAAPNTTDGSSASAGGPYQLPPKKRKRCFNEMDCSNCKTNLSGEICCKCPNGHSTCAKCLEERVKKVLTGKAKESIRCLNVSCDSFYPISELKLCLPSMVVEILEDKLGQDYVDYFSTMILKTAMDETNSDTSLDIPVDMDEDEGVGTSGVVTIPKKPAETDPELPEHWEPMNEKSAYQMFTLDVNSDEYNQILPLFFSSMISQKVEVVKIKRVQNPILWKFYSVKKKEMLLDNEGFGAVNEQQLYHGTDTSVVDAICKKGFDWRVCGKNGTMYGQGTYFAVNASYSHQYTDIKASRQPRHTTLIPHSTMNIPMSSAFGSNMQSQVQPVVYNKHAFPPNAGLSAINLSSNQTTLPSRRYMILPVQAPPSVPKYKILPKPVSIRTMSGMPTWPLEEFIEQRKQTTQMFVARVLVGKYSGGSSKLRKPPPLDPKSDPFGKCYDSCVDDIHMPKIFVIFDSAQAYPEYLIEYTYE